MLNAPPQCCQEMSYTINPLSISVPLEKIHHVNSFVNFDYGALHGYFCCVWPQRQISPRVCHL